MHVAPVVVVSHAAGPDEWSDTVAGLADRLTAHSDLPITVRMPGAAVETVSREQPDTWQALPKERISWLAGGWSDPVLVDIPPAAREVQLARERAAMDAAGISPDALWVGDGWEPAFVDLATSMGLDVVVIDDRLVGGPASRPGAVDRAGTTILVVPLSKTVDEVEEDGLAVVHVGLEDLDDIAERYAGRLTTPEWYRRRHLPGPRLVPAVTAPDRPPDAEPFYRRLLLLTRQHPEKRAGSDALLSLQSREFTTADAGPEAERRLLETRRHLERAAHRGESWVVVSEVDWDSDGVEEVQIETWSTSLIVDPSAATLDGWEHKRTGWPITSVRPVLTGMLMRSMDGDGEEPSPGRFHLERRSEGRGEAEVRMVGDDGSRVTVELSDDELTLDLAVAPCDPIRIGPEIPLCLDRLRASLRVDGGEWMTTDEPRALTGHRFRLTDGERTMLVSASRPTQLYVRPLKNRGLLIWPHWPTTGDARYRITLHPS